MKILRWIGVCLAACALLCVAAVCYLNWYKPKVYKPSLKLEEKITKKDFEGARWDVPTSPEMLQQINTLFSQHFYYIGQGKQCSAYVSHDGNYVVKFLLQKPLTLKPQFIDLPDYFPFSLFKDYKVDKRLERKDDLYNSFMLSYNVVQEETGIFYVHLNPTDNLFKKPVVVDVQGDPVVIDPDKTQFVLQKRARHVKPVLIDLMCAGKTEEAKARIDQMLMLLYTCAKKGVIDTDTGLIRRNNIGFLDNRAIYVDTGKLRLVKQTLTRKDFIKDLKRLEPFNRWLKAYYPELAEHYVEKRKQLVDSF
ncbi:MAG: hypothetical protein JSR37_04140 [Verrucomicrobia bacterium]|nr:hypothetical protein [Verrucomicrobiota bacterium]MBS0635995.1 hypothetical protein [Verrucomicrobiota bacterium]